MSQNTRATGTSPGCQGSSWKVLGSGRARTSDSWTRLKPSMAEPSKVMPSSRAFSSSAGVMREGLGRAQHVGEPQLDEADGPLLDRPQHVFLLAAHGASARAWHGARSVRPGPALPVSQAPGRVSAVFTRRSHRGNGRETPRCEPVRPGQASTRSAGLRPRARGRPSDLLSGPGSHHDGARQRPAP